MARFKFTNKKVGDIKMFDAKDLLEATKIMKETFGNDQDYLSGFDRGKRIDSMKFGFDIRLLDEIEYTIYELTEKNILPIEIVKFLKANYDQIPIYYIQKLIHDYMEQTRLYRWCEKNGHAFVDESYGGPESGAIAAYCKKCGYSFNHILY